jgi:hypothetical protein
MALTAKALNSVMLIAGTAQASATTIVTNPAATDTYITGIILYNSHSAAIDVTLCRVPASGGSIGTDAVTDNFYKESIPAGRAIMLGKEDGLPMVLESTNDTLKAFASITNKINIFVNGVLKT